MAYIVDYFSVIYRCVFLLEHDFHIGRIQNARVLFSLSRCWSSALKKVWYAVLVYQTSIVSRYSTSSTTHAFYPLHYRY